MLQIYSATSSSYESIVRNYELSEKFVPVPHVQVHTLFHTGKRPLLGLRATVAALFLCAFLFVNTPVVRAETLSLEQLSQKTQEIYEKTTDLKARFVQEVTIKSMKKTEKEEGVVTFKNPKMMLWDYQKPKAKKLVINAKTAWLYVPEDRMVYVQSAEDIYRSRIAVRFLSGLGKLSEDFHIRFTDDTPRDKEGNYLLTLTAKESGSGIDRLYLVVDGKTFQIIQCRFDDAFGNTNRLRFSDIRLNTGASATLFTFKVPEGVEVVDMPK
jgi:outer membrane lipoprotein carrier protein